MHEHLDEDKGVGMLGGTSVGTMMKSMIGRREPFGAWLKKRFSLTLHPKTVRSSSPEEHGVPWVPLAFRWSVYA